MLFTRKQAAMVDEASALPGRTAEMPIPPMHEVLGRPLKGPFPEGFEQIVVGRLALQLQVFGDDDEVARFRVGYLAAVHVLAFPEFQEEFLNNGFLQGRHGHLNSRPAALCVLGYEHTLDDPAILLWNDDRHAVG